ncbi:hypothetical protein ACI2L1_23030 [Streptomyces sp. NPDC019531]|uniref:hypothetical protein n=1 Tax=Streptomyces sp. NPDC019531 TaxID=3365062 RepID=UPI0038500296
MTEQPSGDEKKVVAIRVSPTFKKQLDSVVELTSKTLNEAGVEALEDWVAKTLSDPTIREKAMQNIQAEEQALQERRRALQDMLGEGEAAAVSEKQPAPAERPAGRRGKTSGE